MRNDTRNHLTALPLQQTLRPPGVLRRMNGGGWFCDFLRAAFGTLQIHLDSPSDGTLAIHLGECVNHDGRVERNPSGSQRYRRIELPIRRGRHTYRLRIPPDDRNTGPMAVPMPAEVGEVLPFRYAEIEGYDGPTRTGITPGGRHQPTSSHGD